MKHIRRMINNIVDYINEYAIQDEEYFMMNTGKNLPNDEELLSVYKDLLKSQKLAYIDDDATPQQIIDYIYALDVYMYDNTIDKMIYDELERLNESGKYDNADNGLNTMRLEIFERFYDVLGAIEKPTFSYFIVKSKLDMHDEYPYFYDV
jgi:hypothetical protein